MAKKRTAAVAEPPQDTGAAPESTVGEAIAPLDFGGLSAKAPASKSKKAYPLLPDPQGKVAKMVRALKTALGIIETQEGQVDLLKGQLRSEATPFYFQYAHGKSDAENSVAARDGADEVLIAFSTKARMVDPKVDVALRQVLGNAYPAYFRQGYELKIDGDKVPAASAQAFINDLKAAAAKHGCLDAISVKAGVKPTDTFWTDRHVKLDVATCLKIEGVLPSIVSVKTKGRK